MISAFYKWVDRKAIRHAAAHMAQPDGRDLHLDEARTLAERLAFDVTDIKPAVIQFGVGTEFRFASPRPSEHALNDVVRGRLYPCGETWKQRPAVLLLHGWNDFLNHHYFFPRHARLLNKMGFNAVTLQSPWHFERRPREMGAWGNFLSADVRRTIHAALQAVAEIRSTISWLKESGCPFVALWGVSMGAWLAGLTLCHDPRINAAVLTVPVARLDRLIQDVPFCRTIRDALQNRPVDLSRLSLASNRPVIPRENILIIEAEHDLFVDKQIVEELWQSWDKPEIWRYPHAHVSILCAVGLPSRVVNWIKAKADAMAAK